MLIRTRSLMDVGRVAHKLGRRLGDGKREVIHPEVCECFILHSVAHAHWVSYNVGTGKLFCDRCKTEEDLPCPARKDTIFSRVIHMHPEAIASDLLRFQLKHQDCDPPPSCPPPSES